MEKAEEELERRSKFLNSLILRKKSVEEKQQNEDLNVRVRASDMPFSLQNHAFKCTRDNLDATMVCGKLDSKRLALVLKKVYGFLGVFALWVLFDLISSVECVIKVCILIVVCVWGWGVGDWGRLVQVALMFLVFSAK
ncbi:hypothetical protein KY290_000045 [Solanum tuberosum]|uniref:Dynein light chain n=1 Tax=Solanum tuberosum TaxID=4113 RepID=A0ABQ7WI84_SOLTU|nr:hypothetical protein KY289_000054 [Solanum tuberosum]KAH0780447.1 hypothetical protein KY290_000045 [Solanum tuberosum]